MSDSGDTAKLASAHYWDTEIRHFRT